MMLLLLAVYVLEGLPFVHGAAQPIQQPWSLKTYGPDGPWNAVTASIGGQSVDLKPGGYYQSWILSDKYCQNKTLFGTNPCDASGAGLVGISSVTDLSDLPGFTPNASWVSGQPGNGSAVELYPLDIQIPVTNPVTATDVSAALVDYAWLALPDGTQYPHTLGSLSLGGPAYNQSFGSINYTMIPPSLYKNGITPSSSVGLHIGSASLGISGSMYYGGYDRARVLGDVLVTASQTTGTYPPYTGIELLDIGIDTAAGSSPFTFTSTSGLLAQGNSSIKGSLQVEVRSNSPYIYLPQSTCDAIASKLPVTWQAKYGLYFWNTQDPNYSRIVTSASYLYFKFRADGLTSGSLSIKVPWSLLNLTLQEPIISSPVSYFPCRPSTPTLSATYVLGQAFLQAAFFAIDWKPDAPPGNWFLAQAPGPGVATLPDVVTIQNGATTLSASNRKWEDTWTGHWTALSGSPSGSSGSSGTSSTSDAASSQDAASDGGLSVGTKAGIGFGVAAAAVLAGAAALVLWRRQRQKKAMARAPAIVPYRGNEKPPPRYDTLDAPETSVQTASPHLVYELGDGAPAPREMYSP